MSPADGSLSTRPRAPAREIHVRDLVAVLRRHWKVVVLLSVVVAGGAYFRARNAIPQFQSRLTVQIASPKQVFARLDDIDIDEMALRTDPVLSEALVLTTQQLALRVVDILGLQFEPVDPRTFRGDVVTNVTVDSLAQTGEFTLRLNGATGSELLDAAGNSIASGPYSDPLAGPGFSIQVAPSDAARDFGFRVIRPEEAASWVSAGLSYRVREGTNAVDMTFTGTDRTLVPLILNEAAVQLRLDGAQRARSVAARKRTYIAEQVDRANSQYQVKLHELQQYKEGNQITDLSSEEQSIVSSIQLFEQDKLRLMVQESTVRDAIGGADSIGIGTLNSLAAVQGISENPALGFQIDNLLKLYDERRTMTAGALGLRDNNPQVKAFDSRILQGHQALRAAVRAVLIELAIRQKAINDKIAEQRARLRTYPGKESRIAELELEKTILHETYQYLLSQHASAQMQEATISPYITILDGASPAGAIGTTLRQKVILGLLVGLLLGLAGAFFLEYLDQTIKTAADLERVLGVPVLGQIPYDVKLSSENGRRQPIVVVSSLSPDEPVAEAYRALRTNVTFVGAEKPLQLIAVTSPGPGEGKSTTATNLAVTLGQGGHRTILVDGDLRRPLVHRAFGLVQEPGLTDVLVGSAAAREAIRPQVAPNLDVLPSGASPPNPSELLGSDAMHQLIAELRRSYDYIVIDTPPTLPVTDAAVIATNADATILAVRSGDTEESAALRAFQQLRRVNARIAGSVLNAVTKQADQYYSYYSYRRDTPTRRPSKSIRARIADLL